MNKNLANILDKFLEENKDDDIDLKLMWLSRNICNDATKIIDIIKNKNDNTKKVIANKLEIIVYNLTNLVNENKGSEE